MNGQHLSTVIGNQVQAITTCTFQPTLTCNLPQVPQIFTFKANYYVREKNSMLLEDLATKNNNMPTKVLNA